MLTAILTTYLYAAECFVEPYFILDKSGSLYSEFESKGFKFNGDMIQLPDIKGLELQIDGSSASGLTVNPKTIIHLEIVSNEDVKSFISDAMNYGLNELNNCLIIEYLGDMDYKKPITQFSWSVNGNSYLAFKGRSKRLGSYEKLIVYVKTKDSFYSVYVNRQDGNRDVSNGK